MKKLLILLMAAMMLFAFTACGGGNELAAAAAEIEEITGEPATADDVKEMMEQLEALTGEKVSAQDVVEFTRDMYALASGDWGDDEPEDEEWPFNDIPEWPIAEGLEWSDYYDDGTIDLYVAGGEEEMNEWLAELRKEGFNGYFWGGDDLRYINEDYTIYLDDRGAGENEYHLVIREEENILGLPEELQGLFPEYNGDGACLYGFTEEYGAGEGVYYFFSVYGETEEGGLRYLQALKNAGFESSSDSHYSGAGGYYDKTVGDKTYGYASEEYWYQFDNETNTGWAEFCLVIVDAE